MPANSPLNVSAWIKRLGPDFKDSIAHYSFSCVFPYHQIRVDEPFLHDVTNHWVLTQHVIRFNGVELCPTIEEFGAIMVNWRLTISFSLPWVGISPPYCKLCYASLLLRPMVVHLWQTQPQLSFRTFFQLSPLVGERPHSYFLCAFCLCALARYFLVQKSYCVDLQMCMVVYELKRGNPVGLILAETLNGMDAFHRKEASFFARSTLLLQV